MKPGLSLAKIQNKNTAACPTGLSPRGLDWQSQTNQSIWTLESSGYECDLLETLVAGRPPDARHSPLWRQAEAKQQDNNPPVGRREIIKEVGHKVGCISEHSHRLTISVTAKANCAKCLETLEKVTLFNTKKVF
jgi:hypothetical protein